MRFRRLLWSAKTSGSTSAYAYAASALLVVGGVGLAGWRVRKDWSRVSSMEAFGQENEALLGAIALALPDAATIVGTHNDNSRKTKLREMKQLYQTLARRNNSGVAFDACVNLLSLHDPRTAERGDLFLLLPHLYTTHAVADNVFCVGSSRQREAASHYTVYTRELCMCYFLRNGHILTYLTLLVKSHLSELLIFSSAGVVVNSVRT
jgi:hypothetical protein